VSNSQKLSIDEQIAKLNKTSMPNRDLWPGIEYGIANEQLSQSQQHAHKRKRTSAKPLLAIAASIFVAMVIGFFSFEHGRLESGQALIVQMSSQHSAQKEALLTSLAGQPTTTQNWQQQLNELDEAAVAIKKALENEPNNAALLKMLQRIYEQQITLIERVHAPAWQQI
jgi:uncharacterized protein YhaN